MYLFLFFLVFGLIFLSYKGKEYFQETIATSTSELETEINNLSYQIGSMVTDAYSYLRTKYSLGDAYKPMDEGDELLQDTKLKAFRVDIASIIDATRKRLKDTFGDNVMDSIDGKHSIFYERKSNDVLKITHVVSSVEFVYFV